MALQNDAVQLTVVSEWKSLKGTRKGPPIDLRVKDFLSDLESGIPAPVESSSREDPVHP